MGLTAGMKWSITRTAFSDRAGPAARSVPSSRSKYLTILQSQRLSPVKRPPALLRAA